MNRGTVLAGLVFIVLGVVFLLQELDVLDLRPGVILPALLIAVGVAVVLTARTRT